MAAPRPHPSTRRALTLLEILVAVALLAALAAAAMPLLRRLAQGERALVEAEAVLTALELLPEERLRDLQRGPLPLDEEGRWWLERLREERAQAAFQPPEPATVADDGAEPPPPPIPAIWILALREGGPAGPVRRRLPRLVLLPPEEAAP